MNVTVHFTVWSDPRYDSLARILGRTRKDVIGCMAMLWSECTDRETEYPPEYIINGCLDSEQGVAALVQCGLGETTPNGPRVRGCKDRIEWAAKKRNAGLASAKKRAEAKASTVQHSSTSVPTPVEHVLNEKDQNEQKASTDVQQVFNTCSTSGTQVLRDPRTKEEIYIPARGGKPDYLECWNYCVEKFSQLKASGLDPTAKAWPSVGPHTSSDMFDEVRARLSDCISRTASHEAAMAEFRHAVDVRAAQAIAAKTLKWFTPSQFIAKRADFLRCCDESIEQASAVKKPTVKPFGKPPEPVRRMTVIVSDPNRPDPVDEWRKEMGQ